MRRQSVPVDHRLKSVCESYDLRKLMDFLSFKAFRIALSPPAFMFLSHHLCEPWLVINFFKDFVSYFRMFPQMFLIAGPMLYRLVRRSLG